jgi:hypothetical protein
MRWVLSGGSGGCRLIERRSWVINPSFEVAGADVPAAGATVRRVICQQPPARRSFWVITAAARMAGGAAGSMISSTDRATAWPPRGPASTTGLRVR